MREPAKRPTPGHGPPSCHPASWSEPTPRPSVLGMVVAATIGATAAVSWSLSTWITFSQMVGRQHEVPEVIAADAPPGTPTLRPLEPMTANKNVSDKLLAKDGGVELAYVFASTDGLGRARDLRAEQARGRAASTPRTAVREDKHGQ